MKKAAPYVAALAAFSVGLAGCAERPSVGKQLSLPENADACMFAISGASQVTMTKPVRDSDSRAYLAGREPRAQRG